MVKEFFRLYFWSPVLIRNKLYFVGIKKVAESAVDMWRTSKVVGRMGSKRVVTASGKVYTLVGKLVVPAELRDNVPVWVEDRFKLGLPRNWEEVVNQWAWVKKLETEWEGRGVGEDGIEIEVENPRKELPSTLPSPTKLVRGIPYNYSCIYCSVIPRPKSICRSELYRHYANCHFANQLREQFGKMGQFCGDCKRDIKTSNWVTHMGQVHGKVELFLPAEARLPIKRTTLKGECITYR